MKDIMNEATKIYDNHVHTHYAYCSQNNMLPENSIKIAKDKGYGIFLVEHAGQLYVNNEDYWNENIVNKPKLIYDETTNRMDEYIKYVSGFRETDVKLGLELDMNCEGEVTMRSEHAESFELFLGAVHYINSSFTDIDKGFLWSVDAFCDYGVDILAHPFRLYKRKNLEKPTHLYHKVAKALAKSNVAAEINFHTNDPDPEFFLLCIKYGVKIALGSDAHRLDEVCAFDKYYELLNRIYNGSINEILYIHK